MEVKNNPLSIVRLSRLRMQGYTAQSEHELTQLAFGIRFAYRACTIIIIIAIVTQSIALFSVMTIVAILGIVLPNHPFDYIFNYLVRKWMDKPEVPPRSIQLKFACMIASLCLTIITSLLIYGFTTIGLLIAGSLVLVAALPSTVDYCIPSAIYNVLFIRKSNDSPATIQKS
ncbi:MAG: DUF4395 family protein [Cyclobacteriaceae bacterium]